jgi:hypothetical protein
MKVNKSINEKFAFILLPLFIIVIVCEVGAWTRGPNNELIVGYENPNEVDTISSDFYLYGDLYIMNDAELIISNTVFDISGNIYIINNGKLTIENSEINILNAQDFHFYIMAVDSGQISFNSSVLSTTGFSSHLYARHNASVRIENSLLDSSQYAWLIAYFTETASLYVVDSEFPKEVVPNDSVNIYVRNSNSLASAIAIWLNFHYNEHATLRGLKSPFDYSNVSISPDDPDIDGIDYTITTENAHIYWLINPGYFTEIRIVDSAVALALFLHGYNGKDFINLAPSYFADYQLPLYDFERAVFLENSSIVYWQLYLSGTGNEWAETYRILDSEINELIVFNETYVRISNSILGPAALGAIYTGEISITDSTIKSLRIIGFDNAKVTLEGCRLEGMPVIASDSAAIYLKNVELAENVDNTLLPVDNPTTLNTFKSGRIYLANVDEITGTYTIGEEVVINGSALIEKGPDSSIGFENYHFEYSLEGTDIWQEMGTIHSESVMDSELERWDTSGISDEGTYLLKLVITDTDGNTFHAFGKVILVN